ncbi:MAG: hypothetical protein ABI678_15325 [Kofleriaceae bacterium]
MIDTGAMGPCVDGPNGDTCFLSPTQRQALVTEYESAVGGARTSCVLALSDLRFEVMMRKDDDISFVSTLLLSIIGTIVETALSAAISAALKKAGSLMSGAARVAAKAGASATVDPSRVKQLVNAAAPAVTVAEKLVAGVESAAAKGGPKALAKTAADAGKQQLKGQFSDPEAGGSRGKEKRTEYIDYLKAEMEDRFQALQQGPPGVATDTELLALKESFNISHHREATYRSHFAAAIERYANSPVSDIGRHTAYDEKRGNAHVELETRVAWLLTRGAGRRLIYVDRAFETSFHKIQDRSTGAMSRGSAYDSGTNQLSLQADATWSHGGEEQTHHEVPLGPDLMLNYVEPEFIALALEMQAQTWLAPAETFMLDYSYLPPKMVKVAS